MFLLAQRQEGPGLTLADKVVAQFTSSMRRHRHTSLRTGMSEGHLSKKLKTKNLIYSYMDDLYPSMTINTSGPLSSVAELYVYGSAVVGIIASFLIICYGEPKRVYRIMKRKNTDESPVIQI
jgi:hypothetical protein